MREQSEASTMELHHLDCAPLRPLLPPFAVTTLCTLADTGSELFLVDTGLGTRDFAAPSAKMRIFTALTRAGHDVSHTAVRQIEALAYEPRDVKHILITHLHLDHSGGLPDFPQATVHVYGPEYRAAIRPSGLQRLAYDPGHWRHGPRWRVHEAVEREAWFGFDAIEVSEIASATVLMIPLVGHSPGHVGVAIRTERSWLLHCGSAFPPGGFASTVPAWIVSAARSPHIRRLRRLPREHGGQVQIIRSHVPLKTSQAGVPARP
jgi:glyoxylase-like metal-dependent hydrolase (beta-lactamase superfamily II)